MHEAERVLEQFQIELILARSAFFAEKVQGGVKQSVL
jgi:hypothetical protein